MKWLIFLSLLVPSVAYSDQYEEAARYTIVALARKTGFDKMAQNKWDKIKTKYELDTCERVAITIGQVGQMVVTRQIIFTYNF